MGESSSTKPIGSSEPKRINRRATVRYRRAPENPGRAFFANSSKSIDAEIVDLSLGGIGLMVDTHIEPGTLVRIDMGGGKVPYADLVAHTTYATPLDDGRWRCGCAWVHELSEAELQILR